MIFVSAVLSSVLPRMERVVFYNMAMGRRYKTKVKEGVKSPLGYALIYRQYKTVGLLLESGKNHTGEECLFS